MTRPLRALTLSAWVGLACTGSARGQTPIEEPIEAPASDGPEEGSFAFDLDEAKALYFRGELDQAQLALRALQLRFAQNPDLMPFDQAVEALTYLGEILVKQGEDDEAGRVFRSILEQDIEARISPYHHPADVVFVFNRVREQIEAERAAEVPETPVVPPAPASSYLPLGIPQFSRGRVGAGLLYGGGQVVLGGVAVGTYLHLRVVNRPQQGHPLGWTEEQIVRRTQVRRYGLQWPSTVAFYALWVASAVEARNHWRREHRPSALGRITPMVVPPSARSVGTVGVTWEPRR